MAEMGNGGGLTVGEPIHCSLAWRSVAIAGRGGGAGLLVGCEIGVSGEGLACVGKLDMLR